MIATCVRRSIHGFSCVRRGIHGFREYPPVPTLATSPTPAPGPASSWRSPSRPVTAALPTSQRYQQIKELNDLGEFDYVLCHGVFFRVPLDVQKAILDLCRRQLAPDGHAFVS